MFLNQITLLVLFFCSYVFANMAPSYPEPGTVWKSGNSYEITWVNDKHSPSIAKAWKDFRIDFMTGDNMNQKFLINVAKNLDGTKIKSFNWTVPEVEPHAAIYFFKFSNGKGQDAWTTRFAITGQDGKLFRPQKSTQPDGAKIPWGIGKLVNNDIDSKNSNQKEISTITDTNSVDSAIPPITENNIVDSVIVSNNTKKNNLSFSVLLISILATNSFLYLLQ
ncbi:uncharacterized protein BX663DRAFT_269628 [Cokeromyces recurvatus]|uniref:uncharacterized protein n=1 Tax=Cokeromyces recurvatus TaxID=90255 RepID=UPI00221FDF02|nr:uncharacterized protein BX663DRAFT_269628 [Cokeromyces recurvatus]KAI7898184.1 hypothetical protein BX663DRAFT_269628 [Cokeromyces recurvatus]